MSDNVPHTQKFLTVRQNLCFEAERLKTFIDWPLPWLSPIDLARWGLYYLRKRDHCACAFCHGIIGVWEPSDNPRSEHTKHFPRCPFMRGEAVGNVTIEQGEVIQRLYPWRNNSLTIPTRNTTHVVLDGSHRNVSTRGLERHTEAVTPSYQLYDSRKASFNTWPIREQQGITNEGQGVTLAQAGFYAVGLSDHVRCYHCGIGLLNWRINNDPWVEHARWSPTCNFLLTYKGEAYVNEIHDSVVNYERAYPPVIPSSEDLATLMSLDVVVRVSIIGVPRDTLEAVVKSKLYETGYPYQNMEALLDDVLERVDPMMIDDDLSYRDAVALGMPAVYDPEANPITEDERFVLTFNGPQNVEVGTIDMYNMHFRFAVNENTQIVRSEPIGITLSIDENEFSNRPNHPSNALIPPPDELVIQFLNSLLVVPRPSVIQPTNQNSNPILTQDGEDPNVGVEVPNEVIQVQAPNVGVEVPNEVMQMQHPTDLVEFPNEVIQVQAPNVGMEVQDPNEGMDTPPTQVVQPQLSVTEITQYLDAVQDNISNHLVQGVNNIETNSPMSEIISDTSSSDTGSSNTGSSNTGSSNTGSLNTGSSNTGSSNLTSSSSPIIEKDDTITKVIPDDVEDSEIYTCKICYDNKIDTVILPCKHMVCCKMCALRIIKCPMCRTNIEYTFKPILV